MHNIATIYRFNTPFLNVENEKNNLISVIKKIEKSIEFDWINIDKVIKNEWNYYNIILSLGDNLWKIEFFYISKVIHNNYYLPVFKVNIFLNDKFLFSNELKEKAVKFLNNIFECFDWLNEKEFLIDLNDELYYTKWLFKTKTYLYYDFSNIEIIRTNFENEEWMVLLEQFILRYTDKNYVLTKENSEEYHKIHWIMLYFIYLVFLMYQNIESTTNAKKELENTISSEIFEWQIELVKNRLLYVDLQQKNTFEQYNNRLELFFKMF